MGGRVTPKKAPGGESPTPRDLEEWRMTDLRPTMPSRSARSARNAPKPDREPAASSRYTPPSRPVRLRPRWHRLVGWLGLVGGVVVAALNDVQLVSNATLFPFGHSEGWLFLGVMIAGGSTWFLGLFDRGTTIYQ